LRAPYVVVSVGVVGAHWLAVNACTIYATAMHK
jgi:hypothetical protein